MKIRRRNQFKDKSYLRHLDCLFWTILSHTGGLKSRHFCGVKINSIPEQTKIKGIIHNRLVVIRLNGINPFPTWHKTLLISKSLEVEK